MFNDEGAKITLWSDSIFLFSLSTAPPHTLLSYFDLPCFEYVFAALREGSYHFTYALGPVWI